MAEKRTKTIIYRRAIWFTSTGKNLDLEDLVKAAHKALPRVAQRKFRRGDGQFIKSIRCSEGEKNGILLHIAVETPDGRASTLPVLEDVSELEVGTTPPPRDSSFMDGDIFAYINGNDVCVCATVVRDAALGTYLSQLFERARLPKEATKFDLTNTPQVSKIKMIKKEGVKEIDIKASLYEATTGYVDRKAGVSGSMASIGKHLKAIFGREKESIPDNLSVTIKLTADMRLKKGKPTGTKALQSLAEELLEEDEDENYTILTKNSQRIGSNEIYVRERVAIDAHGRSINRQGAWNALEKYYHKLKKMGVTEQ